MPADEPRDPATRRRVEGRSGSNGAAGAVTEPPGGARAWLVWGIAVGVYFLAMFHRNGMGVAALRAQERFDVGPALLSMMPMLQLLVYLMLQVPSGMMADRLGPRRSLLAGLVAMGLGVGLFAVAPDARLAVAGRLLIGVGDAVVFLNVIRLGALWFPRGQYALVSSLTGLVGGLGQVASVAPLSALLRGLGWEPTFLTASAVTFLMVLLVALLVRDRPRGFPAAPRSERISLWASLVEALRARGPRVGMVNHTVAMAPFTTLAVLWGYPFLVEGMGLAAPQASLVLSTVAVAPLALVPAVGAIAGRRPEFRRSLGIAMAAAISVGWTAIVVWPQGPPPLPVVVLILLVSAAGSVTAPAVSFDYARDGLPAERTGVASGLVNVSGFLATALGMVGAGVVLELRSGPDSGPDFQLALAPMTVIALAGAITVTVQLVRYPRR